LQRGLSFTELHVMRLILWHGWSESSHLVIRERFHTTLEIFSSFLIDNLHSRSLWCLNSDTLWRPSQELRKNSYMGGILKNVEL
jgi:hypothetical protein